MHDDEVDEQLELLRERFATFDDVDRPVLDGDVVQLDVHARVDGADVAGGQVAGVGYELGAGQVPAVLDGRIAASDQLPATLDEALLGADAGESITIRAQLAAGNSAGKDADLEITVTAVKEKRLPELDDAFAARVGTFKTVDQLRTDLRERLRLNKRAERLYAVRSRVLRQIATAAAVPAPEGVVQDEVEQRRQWMLAELSSMGTSLADVLVAGDKTEEHVEAELREAAAVSVCGQLVLDAVAEAESVHASEAEVGEAIVHRAQRAGVPPQTYYHQLVHSGATDAVFADVRRAKALALVMERVTMKDPGGNPLTLEDLRDRE
jgi:trigger factor